MIEIVFSDSACGSLKAAQRRGKGGYKPACIGVMLSKADGSDPTPEELAAAQKQAEQAHRLEWEKATPMGGNSKDVFGLGLALSIGDISEDDFIGNRQKALCELLRIFPDDPADTAMAMTGKIQETLKSVCACAAQGEELRIWYSNAPDDLCGLYWFMAQLQKLEKPLGAVFVVKLPEYEYGDDDTILTPMGWGEIPPGGWYQYAALSKVATAGFRRYCATRWDQLQKENAPLRAMLNGQLLSVPETIYDSFIRCEIAKEDVEFQEASVVGRVLCNYRLGLGDAWIANRIEAMIADGELVVASAVAKDMPIYHRRLKKNSC